MRDGALFFLRVGDVRGRGCRLGAMPKWAFDCVAYCQGELQTRPCRAQTVQFFLTLYSSNAHFGKAPSRHPLPLTVYWGRKNRTAAAGGSSWWAGGSDAAPEGEGRGSWMGRF